MEVSVAQDRIREVRPAQIRPLEVCAVEVRRTEVRLAQVRFFEARSLKCASQRSGFNSGVILSPLVPCGYSLLEDLEVFFVCHRFSVILPL